MAKAAQDPKRPITITLTAEQIESIADQVDTARDACCDALRDAEANEDAEDAEDAKDQKEAIEYWDTILAALDVLDG